MKKSTWLHMFALSTVFAQGAFGDTTWTGLNSTAWGNSSNWTNGVPTLSDIAIIPDTANVPTISGSSQAVLNLSFNDPSGSLDISNGSLTVYGNVDTNDNSSSIADINLQIVSVIFNPFTYAMTGPGTVNYHLSSGSTAPNTITFLAGAYGQNNEGKANIVNDGASNGELAIDLAGTTIDSAYTTTLNSFTLLSNDSVSLGDSATLSLTGSSSIAGVVSGGGNLIFDSSGNSLVLSGTNTYTGSTTISSGTLALTGGGSIAESNTVLLLASNTILDISGTTSGATINNLAGIGTVKAGSYNQVLTINQPVYSTLFSGSIQDGGIAGGTGANLVVSGAQPLFLSGNNTYTGYTTINGTLSLVNSGSILYSNAVALATPQSILDISGTSVGATIRNLSGNGTVYAGSSSQGFTVYGVFPSTFSGSIQDGGGSGGVGANFNKTGIATFTMSGNNTYTGTSTVYQGILALAGTGSIAASSSLAVAGSAGFDISRSTSGATIQGLSGLGTVSLGANVLTVNTSASNIFAGTIQDGGIGGGTGGGLFKSGTGSLTLSGTSTYTGPTEVAGGALKVNGSITSSVTVYDGAVLGGSGTVNGSVLVDSLGILTHGSTFTITGNADIFGTIALGDEISTIAIGGNLNLEAGSILNIYIANDGNSLVAVDGSIAIDSQSQVNFITAPKYDLLDRGFIFMTSGSESISGRFMDIVPKLSLVRPVLAYSDGYVAGNYVFADFASFVDDANSLNVALALEEVFLSQNPAFSDLFSSLLPLDENGLKTAFNEMQPALFKALAISQENNVIKVHDSVGFRFEQELDQMYCFSFKKSTEEQDVLPCFRDSSSLHVWVDGFGDILRQKSTNYAASSQMGYQAHTGGVSLGIDGKFANYFYLGALGAYTGSDVDWIDTQSSAEIDTGYGGVYFSVLGDVFYVNTAVIGGWSHYTTNRSIDYPGRHAVAKSSHGGSQILSHLDAGINCGVRGVSIRPFNAFDYISQTEEGFTEEGADALSLYVHGTNAIMLRNELGLQLASCFCFNSSKWTVSPKISWVREVRVKGSEYTANFLNTDVPFTVTGYFPDRSLVSPGIMVTGVMWNDRLSLDLYYNGEFGQKYTDHNYGGQIRVGF
jgi:autotransporter-associated beta strand protein